MGAVRCARAPRDRAGRAPGRAFPDDRGPRVAGRGPRPYVAARAALTVCASTPAGRRCVLAEEADVDDLLVDRGLAEIALPLGTGAIQRAAAAVHVLRSVDGRLDRSLPVAHLRRRSLCERAVVLD